MPDSFFSDNKSFLCTDDANVNINSLTYITDNDCEEFVNQVCDYVKYMEISSLAEDLMLYVQNDYPEVYSNDENGSPKISLDSIDTDSLKNYIPSSSDDKTTNIEIKDIDASTFEDSIKERIGHIIKNGFLSFIVKDPATVSSLSVDKITFPSVTCQLTEDGINASYGYYKDVSDATYKKACFCEYIAQTFDSYTSVDNGCSDTDSALKYQMEYVIYGSPDDDVNLINCSLQLVALRTGFNLIHLFTDKDKFNAALKIAESTPKPPIPGATYVIQMGILTAWATAEAVIDVRDLLEGKSVSLFKTSDQWSLSLQGLKNFSKNTLSLNKGNNGLSYEKYLEMLLAVQNNISVYYRTLDLIQMNICNEYSKDFRISRCVTGIDATITYNISFLFLNRNCKYKSKINYKYN